MNAHIFARKPLFPIFGKAPLSNLRRPARRRLGGVQPLEATGPGRFNRLLARLRHASPGDETAAAGLGQEPVPAADPESHAIGSCMRMAGVIGQMMADPAWPVAEDVTESARRVLERARGADGAMAGHRSASAVPGAAWSRLAEEAEAYLDFRRLREIEAELRGCSADGFAFGIDDWLEARRAEAGLIAHGLRNGSGSYLPSPSPSLFRIC